MLALAFGAFVYLNNTSFLAGPIGSGPVLWAHRGVAQDFDREGLRRDTCTAARLIPTGHDYLENTIPSMRAAFDFGAEVVEFDVHPTTDGRFAVFHDWAVECGTDGRGITREKTLAELQRLDVGHGSTFDGGKTFPFRGRGIGLMPSLKEVLTTFPDRSFVINVKSDDPAEGVLLAERLDALSAGRQGEIIVYGGSRPIAEVRARLPHLRTLTRPRLKKCVVRYIAWGWSGKIPEACRNTLLTLPANVAPWLWGWPDRLLQRMDGVGTSVALLGDWHGERYSKGFNDLERLRQLPADYSGGIWTDRIDLLGPALRQGSESR